MQGLSTLTIPAEDVIRLILAHLTEAGYHETVRCLRRESGVGMAGMMSSSRSTVYDHAMHGNWSAVLQALASLDRRRGVGGNALLSDELLAAVHEMAILEIAENDQLEIAFAMLKLLQTNEELAQARSELDCDKSDGVKSSLTVSRSLNLKLAELAAMKDRSQLKSSERVTVRDDWYGGCDESVSLEKRRQERRENIAQRLRDAIPQQPQHRLITLLQQAIKWQSYTGQLPRVRRFWEEEDEGKNDDDNRKEGHSKKSKSNKRQRREFDIVLGESTVDSIVFDRDEDQTDAEYFTQMARKKITQDYATVKFGKSAVCESAIFMPDGSAIVTGSSDGLIELYNIDTGKHLDLPYQKNDEMMAHNVSVMAIAATTDAEILATGDADGTVNLWNVATGKCLRSIQSSASSVAALDFSPESSHLLIANTDGIAREFGLRTGRMLKEFRGHASYITQCYYHIMNDHQLVVITSSGDGTVRIWNGKTAEVWHILKPPSINITGKETKKQKGIGMGLAEMTGTSILVRGVEHSVKNDDSMSSPVIHTVLKLHTPTDALIIVPRGLRAFLVDCRGVVLRTFQVDADSRTKGMMEEPSVFVAATVSANNRWLYAVKDDGVCYIFDVTNGHLDSSIQDFGNVSTSGSKTMPATMTEVSSILYHPHKEILASFSNDKSQKKGRLLLWK
jgi:WD40 repeat-containing protein SMU1